MIGWAGAATAGETPRRWVSLCLPGDQLLLQLVPREEIAALSWLAVDPDLSLRWQEARGIPATHGAAEELVALKPDLVLVGAYSTRSTAAMLRRLHVPMVEIGVPNNFDELRAQIREVARALGPAACERAEAIVAKMDARLHRLAVAAVAGGTRTPTPRPTALFYFQGGYIPGSHSFASALLQAAGFDNLGPALASRETASLEQVILGKPQFLFLTDYRKEHPTLTGISERHPLLRHLQGTAVVSIPFRDLACPDPSNLDLVEQLQLLASGRKEGGR